MQIELVSLLTDDQISALCPSDGGKSYLFHKSGCLKYWYQI